MIPRERKRLLVEGEDDLYAIAELMGFHINWPNKKSDAPVRIEAMGGANKILAEDTIPIRLKSPEVEILGVIIDADNSFDARWARLRQLAKPYFPGLSDGMSRDGIIVDNDFGKRFGLWVMPDNQSHGMLETFLQLLVPVGIPAIWDHAKAAVTEARSKGATCSATHLDKAYLHTWLAWQDPPGERFGTAILRNVLDARSTRASPFVDWFRKLYQV